MSIQPTTFFSFICSFCYFVIKVKSLRIGSFINKSQRAIAAIVAAVYAQESCLKCLQPIWGYNFTIKIRTALPFHRLVHAITKFVKLKRNMQLIYLYATLLRIPCIYVVHLPSYASSSSTSCSTLLQCIMIVIITTIT